MALSIPPRSPSPMRQTRVTPVLTAALCPAPVLPPGWEGPQRDPRQPLPPAQPGHRAIRAVLDARPSSRPAPACR